jgi:hypothetical protein
MNRPYLVVLRTPFAGRFMNRPLFEGDLKPTRNERLSEKEKELAARNSKGESTSLSEQDSQDSQDSQD